MKGRQRKIYVVSIKQNTGYLKKNKIDKPW